MCRKRLSKADIFESPASNFVGYKKKTLSSRKRFLLSQSITLRAFAQFIVFDVAYRVVALFAYSVVFEVSVVMTMIFAGGLMCQLTLTFINKSGA